MLFAEWIGLSALVLLIARKPGAMPPVEQGQNGAEIPMFDPTIEKAEAEIERLERSPKGAGPVPATGGQAR